MPPAPKFAAGAKAYGRDGRVYTVETSDAGTVYCTSANGAETEFPESSLMTEREWAARADGRRDASYVRLKQARTYSTAVGGIDRALAVSLVTKVNNLTPGLLDFVAFKTAERILTEQGDDDLAAALSIVKARDVFDAATPEVRTTLIAQLLGADPIKMAAAAPLGEHLMRAMIDRGLAPMAEEFEDFCDRPRK